MPSITPRAPSPAAPIERSPMSETPKREWLKVLGPDELADGRVQTVMTDAALI